MGLALLEGQVPGHHGVEDDTSGGVGFPGRAPSPPLPSLGVLEPVMWRSPAPRVSLLSAVLACEDLQGCVGHGATEGAQPRVLKPLPIGKAEVCRGHTGRGGAGCKWAPVVGMGCVG